MSLIPMPGALSDDECLLVEAALAFAREELLPLDRAWDVDESSVAQVLPKLSDMGLLSLLIPQTYGGLECSYRTYAAILHEIARWSPSTCVTIGVHNMVGMILSRRASEAVKQQVLPSWGTEENFSAFAVSEAGAGSDVGSTKTSAVEADGGFRVTGEKMWVTNGLAGRWFFTLVRIQGDPPKGDLSAMLIDGRLPGIERTRITGKMGIRGSETAVIHFNEAFVPQDHLVGPRGGGMEVCLAGLNSGRIGIAAQATGIAEACLDEMVSYARQREQFGRPIGSFQAVADMIAQSAVELEAAKVLVWRAASAVDAGTPSPGASAMAKLYASECANRIAYRAVQVHGGAGYVRECRVEQLYRDARITSIYEGTSEIQRIVVARELANS